MLTPLFSYMCMLLFQIRETRKAVHDSESGTRKMAIGHHIGMLHCTYKIDDPYQNRMSISCTVHYHLRSPGERSHVIEKRHNLKTQEKEEHQEFVNLDEGA